MMDIMHMLYHNQFVKRKNGARRRSPAGSPFFRIPGASSKKLTIQLYGWMLSAKEKEEKREMDERLLRIRFG